MTDLHEEAERLAQYLDAPGRGLVSYDAANTLRELSARLAEVERELADTKFHFRQASDQVVSLEEEIEEVERERDDLRQQEALDNRPRVFCGCCGNCPGVDT